MNPNQTAMQMLARRTGLGAGFPEGLGALGPIGNVASLAPGKYKSTGDGVNIRDQALFSAPIVGTVNTGDTVQATGEVDGDSSPGTSVNPRGELVNFAHITGPVAGWIAVEYLAPVDFVQTSLSDVPWPNPAPWLGKKAGEAVTGGGGGGTSSSSATVTAPAGKDLTIPILIGAGVLAAGVVGYAVFMKKGKSGGGKKKSGKRSGAKKRRGNRK